MTQQLRHANHGYPPHPPGPSPPQEAIKLGIAQRPPCRFEVIQMHVPESGVPVRVQHPSTDDTVCSKGKMPASEGRGSSGGGSGGGCGTNGERLEVGDGDEVTVVLDVAHNPPAIVRAMEKVCVVSFVCVLLCVMLHIVLCLCVCVEFVMGIKMEVFR